MSDLPLLTILILVPLVGALAVAFLPAVGDQPKRLGVLVSLVTLAVGVVIAASYDVGDGGLQLTETHEWISAFGVHYALGVDGLGLLMILLTVVPGPGRPDRRVERRRAVRGLGRPAVRGLDAGARGAVAGRCSRPPTCSSSTSSSRRR